MNKMNVLVKSLLLIGCVLLQGIDVSAKGMPVSVKVQTTTPAAKPATPAPAAKPAATAAAKPATPAVAAAVSAKPAATAAAKPATSAVAAAAKPAVAAVATSPINIKVKTALGEYYAFDHKVTANENWKRKLYQRVLKFVSGTDATITKETLASIADETAYVTKKGATPAKNITEKGTTLATKVLAVANDGKIIADTATIIVGALPTTVVQTMETAGTYKGKKTCTKADLLNLLKTQYAAKKTMGTLLKAVRVVAGSNSSQWQKLTGTDYKTGPYASTSTAPTPAELDALVTSIDFLQ